MNGLIKSLRGLIIFSLRDFLTLSVRFSAASFKGLNASPTSPRRPPDLSPSFSIPNTASLNSSVVFIIPVAAPRIAPPASPNGPPTIRPAAAPNPAPLSPDGISFFTISFCLSPILRPSPNKLLLASSLDFMNPTPAPARIPGSIPIPGIIIPGMIPANPYLNIDGKCFCAKLTTDLDTRPEPSRLPVPSSIWPNKASLSLLECFTTLAPAPPIAPKPTGKPVNTDAIRPIKPPASPSGRNDLVSSHISLALSSFPDVSVPSA